MKSIIEEASSVIKAIEKGWAEAGKPQEFSVKILQESEKNFLGMTTRSAKIALIFEHVSSKTHEQPEKKVFVPKPAPVKPKPLEVKPAPKEIKAPKPQPKPQTTAPVEKKAPKKVEDFWSEQMIDEAGHWLKNSLALINKQDINFTFDQKRYYLKINFNKPLFEDKDKEKVVFRSFAYILMQVLRNKFKRNLRGFKLILTSDLQSV